MKPSKRNLDRAMKWAEKQKAGKPAVTKYGAKPPAYEPPKKSFDKTRRYL